MIVEGSLPLTGATYTILPDRIETATFLCACAACGGALTLRRTDPRLADPVLNALTESGCRISCSHDTIQIFRDSPAGNLRSGRFKTVSRLSNRRDADAALRAAVRKGTNVLYRDDF